MKKHSILFILLLTCLALSALGQRGSEFYQMRLDRGYEPIDKAVSDSILAHYEFDNREWAVMTDELYIDTILVSISDTMRTSIYTSDTFKLSIIAWDSFFLGDVDFRAATFLYDIDFSTVTFSGYTNFWNTIFLGRADFGRANFLGDVDFWYADFFQDVSFWNATFLGNADFWEVAFLGNAYFSDVTFSGYTVFWNTNFLSNADFGRSSFLGDVDFYKTVFSGIVNFKRGKFKGDIHFDSTSLSQKIIFTEADFFKPIDWMQINPYEYKVEIASSGTIMKIDSSIPKRTLNCYGVGDQAFLLDYSQFQVDTSMPDPDMVLAQYRILMNGFKDQGFDKNYRLADLEYRYYKSHYENKWYKKVIHFFQKCWWNYGYDKQWVLFPWTPLFFAFFLLIFWARFKYFLYRVYKIKPIIRRYELLKFKHEPGSWGHRFYTLALAGYYTFLIFFGLRMTHSNFSYKHHAGAFVVLAAFVTGLICLGFLANWIVLG